MVTRPLPNLLFIERIPTNSDGPQEIMLSACYVHDPLLL